MRDVSQNAIVLDRLYGIRAYEGPDRRWFLSVPERWEHLHEDVLLKPYFNTFEDAITYATHVLSLDLAHPDEGEDELT